MSQVQQLIDEALRTYLKRLGRPTILRSFSREAYKQNYGQQRTNAVQNMKWKVVCGGCVGGWVPVYAGEGDNRIRTNERKQHEDCQGLGWRINRRFGRPI